MSRRASFYISIPLLLAAMTLTQCAFSPKVSITKTAHGVEAAEIEFESWTINPRRDLNVHGYAVRLTNGPEGEEFLIRAGGPEFPQSIECYRIGLRHPFPVHAAELEDWSKATVIEKTEGQYLPLGSPTAGPVVTFRGRRYRWRGETASSAAASPEGRWVLLWSHDDGDWIKYRPQLPLGRPGPRSGATYLEVFDAETGEMWCPREREAGIR